MLTREKAEQLALELMASTDGMNNPKTALFVVRLIDPIYESRGYSDVESLPEILYISDDTELALNEQAKMLESSGYRRMKRLRVDKKYGMKLSRRENDK